MRQALLDAVPDVLSMTDLLLFSDTIQAIFRAGLYAINDLIDLKPEEMEFATAGFGDVLRNWTYALIRGQSSGESPSFAGTYYQ